MLCYTYPENLGLDDWETQILRKLIEWNINELKEFLVQVYKFRKTHAQIFRRYKHAGLPIRTGLLSIDDRFPYTTRHFDSYAMVFAGGHPLNDVIILPYSVDVKRSYKYLMKGVQNFIAEAVENKIMSIERKIDGNIPLYNYSNASLSDKELNELQKIHETLNNRYPSWRKDMEVRIHRAQPKHATLQRYLELDNFLEVCRRKAAIYGS